MDSAPPAPAITVLPPENGGGYRVSHVGLKGEGATLDAAFAALSAEMYKRFNSEKGDETAEAETARRQTDILANDRFIRGHALQYSVLQAVALGMI